MKKEIYDIGYEITEVSDGRVTFLGDAEAVVRANLLLRTAERVLLKIGSFRATSYEELFQGTKALPWEEVLPENARFWVTKAASVKSRLFSPSDIQSVMKKAMVERMRQVYPLTQFPEDGASFPVRVFLLKDEVTVAIDTTGESLHKRGYRRMKVTAPIAENLAAALLMLTPWKPGRALVDPFCGSGTFLIEAAMISANIAPGLARSFTAESWTGLIPKKLWKEAREEARSEIIPDPECDLQGYDIDEEAIAAARENARLAGVDHLIHFQVRDVSRLSHPKKYGFVITNPPYGERLLGPGEGRKERLAREQGKGTDEQAAAQAAQQEELQAVYGALGERFRALDSWSLYVISAYPNAERDLGMKAEKNRKIYNGMIRTYFYQFPGPKANSNGRGVQALR